MNIRNTINETSRLGSVKQQTVKLQREKERSIAREKKLAATGPPKNTDILPRESERVKEEKVIVDPSEREVSDLLLQRMQKKLNFMRNPRFDKNKYGENLVGERTASVILLGTSQLLHNSHLTQPNKWHSWWTQKKSNSLITRLEKSMRQRCSLEMLRQSADACVYCPRGQNILLWRWLNFLARVAWLLLGCQYV